MGFWNAGNPFHVNVWRYVGPRINSEYKRVPINFYFLSKNYMKWNWGSNICCFWLLVKVAIRLIEDLRVTLTYDLEEARD